MSQVYECQNYHHAYLSFLVTAGILVTVTATYPLIGGYVLIVLGAFVASGTPMIIGSMYRYMKFCEAEERQRAEEAKQRAAELERIAKLVQDDATQSIT